jgi:hypothetical protein
LGATGVNDAIVKPPGLEQRRAGRSAGRRRLVSYSNGVERNSIKRPCRCASTTYSSSDTIGPNETDMLSPLGAIFRLK